VTSWTHADQAELDVLVHALVFDYWEHSKRCGACQPGPCPELEAWNQHEAACDACQGNAPLTYGPPCPDWRARRLEHGAVCARCNPCPHLQRAIVEVLEWREARALLSKAEALRVAQIESRVA
jgi:hypothetical protein